MRGHEPEAHGPRPLPMAKRAPKPTEPRAQLEQPEKHRETHEPCALGAHSRRVCADEHRLGPCAEQQEHKLPRHGGEHVDQQRAAARVAVRNSTWLADEPTARLWSLAVGEESKREEHIEAKETVHDAVGDPEAVVVQVEEAHLEGRHQRREHAPVRHKTFPQGRCPRVGRDDPRPRPQPAHELTVAAHIRAKRLAPLHRLHLLVALEEQYCLMLGPEGGSCCRHGRGVGARASTAAALALQRGRDRVEQLARGLLDGAADGHKGRRWQLVLKRRQALTQSAHVIDPMFLQQADQAVHPFRRDVRAAAQKIPQRHRNGLHGAAQRGHPQEERALRFKNVSFCSYEYTHHVTLLFACKLKWIPGTKSATCASGQISRNSSV